MEDRTASVLVVANRTAESDELLAALRERAGQGPARFTLVVPATAHGVAWAADTHAGEPEAEAHLRRALERMREAGLEADGKLGDPSPVAAVQDAVNFGSFDEVIVCTLPKHLSKWLRLDLPRRIERASGLPVRHVTGTEVRVPA